jgi:hypothetical protein
MRVEVGRDLPLRSYSGNARSGNDCKAKVAAGIVIALALSHFCNSGQIGSLEAKSVTCEMFWRGMAIMRNKITAAALFSLLLLLSPVVAAEVRKEPRPPVFQKLIDCRAIADAAARLACYDSGVAQIDDAEQKSEIVVVDRTQIKKAKRSLFGLSLPKLGLFGNEDDKGDDAEVLETTIKSASSLGYDKWAFTLEDGARWVQTEARGSTNPKPGQSIKIRRGAMGGYLANIDGHPAIRVKRVN